MQKWDDGRRYEEGERWNVAPKWAVFHSRDTSLECLSVLLDIANQGYADPGQRYRVYCKKTGCGEEVDMGPLRYRKGSHLDLQDRLTAMFKDLVLQGVPAAQATRTVDAEHARAYV